MVKHTHIIRQQFADEFFEFLTILRGCRLKCKNTPLDFKGLNTLETGVTVLQIGPNNMHKNI